MTHINRVRCYALGTIDHTIGKKNQVVVVVIIEMKLSASSNIIIAANIKVHKSSLKPVTGLWRMLFLCVDCLLADANDDEATMIGLFALSLSLSLSL